MGFRRKSQVLKTDGSLMQVESIAECSLGAFFNTFDLHLAIVGLENQFWSSLLSGRLRQVLLYTLYSNYMYYVLRTMFSR